MDRQSLNPRLKNRDPFKPNRQGISIARVMPMRGPIATAGRGPSGRLSSNGGASSGRPSNVPSMPRALVRLPGPLHRRRISSMPRLRRMRASPAVGSIARISTAQPGFAEQQTKFRHQCTPYDRYTYATPGGPNIVRFRLFSPPKLCDAGSSWLYASASTMTPPQPFTKNDAPIRSRATSSISRAKNAEVGSDRRVRRGIPSIRAAAPASAARCYSIRL